jgi:two-component sensor histidine kinase
MTKSVVCLLFIIAMCLQAKCQESKEQWLKSLTETIEESEKYDVAKMERIAYLHEQHAQNPESDSYELYLKLYNEYASFKSDSAYAYAVKLQRTALKLNDEIRAAYARLKLSTILLSSGMFKEAVDSLSIIKFQLFNRLQKAEYYILMARCYYELADYTGDHFYSPQYNSKARSYMDSSLVLFPVNSYEHNYYTGLKHIREGNLTIATDYLNALLAKSGLSPQQVAVTASTLSDIYIRKAQLDTAMSLLAKAAIADIQSATKETSAIFYLANLLFRRGDLINASSFIQKAANDANFFGSRQRKVQLSAIMPLIESQKSNLIVSEKNKIYTYAIIITLSFMTLTVLTIIIIKQIQISKKQNNIIHKKNISLQNLLKDKDSLLKEKEWLLKEIHHRVKNNLQIVMSLLNSQAASLEDKAALSAIQESQHRVQAMALIHQKLYQSEGVASINMVSYIHEVVAYLRESYTLSQQIRFKLEVEEIEMDVTLAVPLGLIINEALTNALKYAFPNGRSGIVLLSLKRECDASYRLIIVDDGVGLPVGRDSTFNRSLGMTIMHGFSAQVGGELQINSPPGVEIRLVFAQGQVSSMYNKEEYAY